jgi:hypothetical protein
MSATSLQRPRVALSAGDGLAQAQPVAVTARRSSLRFSTHGRSEYATAAAQIARTDRPACLTALRPRSDGRCDPRNERIRIVLRLTIASVICAAMLLPGAPADAKTKRVPRGPAPAPAPIRANEGPLDVTQISFRVGSFVNVDTGLAEPVGVHAVAIVGGPTYRLYDEVVLAVRPAGGAWHPSLDFPHAVHPVAFGGYFTVMLSTVRSFPPGTYEARVAARQDSTWIHDEVVTSFTMPATS